MIVTVDGRIYEAHVSYDEFVPGGRRGTTVIVHETTCHPDAVLGTFPRACQGGGSGRGVAVCGDDDQFSRVIGRRIALGRALVSVTLREPVNRRLTRGERRAVLQAFIRAKPERQSLHVRATS